MKTIKIHGEIGWEVWSRDIIRNIEETPKDEDIILDISSPGGIVTQGLDIYNAIRASSSKVIARISGMAASIASYFAMAADEIEVHDNSIFMLHNPMTGVFGDHKELANKADMLRGITDLLAKAYADRTGKTHNKIIDLMSEETWYFGSEIKDEGFADSVIETIIDTEKDKAIDLALAKTRVQDVMAKNRTIESSEFEKMVAICNPIIQNKTAKRQRSTQEIKSMKLEDIKKDYPDIYNTILEEGRAEGRAAEHKRVKAHLNMLDKGISPDFAKEAIRSGKAFDEESQSHYMGEAMAKRDLDNRVADTPDPTNTTPEPVIDMKQQQEDLLAKVLSFSSITR